MILSKSLSSIKMAFTIFSLGLLTLTVFSARCNSVRKTALAIKEDIAINHENLVADEAENFKDLVKHSSVFIDKSLLIKEVVESNSKMLLIICPKGWGKSVNLDMVRTFLQIEVDKEGNAISPCSNTHNHKLFHKGEVLQDDGTIHKLKTPLLISNYTDFLNDYQGKYPVVYLNLKNVSGDDYNAIMDQMKIAIFHTFFEHFYLAKYYEKMLNLKNIRVKGSFQEDLNKFNKILNGTETIQNIEHSLYYLSSLLYDRFHKEVFIMVDEYDMPVRNIFENKKFPLEDMKKTLIFFEILFGSAFKDNPYLKKGIVTGTFRVAQQTLHSKWNNVVEHNTMQKSSQILRYFGFNQEDVEWLFDQHNIAPNLTEQAKQWYNGFQMSGPVNELSFYNPNSILKFLKSKKIDIYWNNFDGTDFMEKALNRSVLIQNKLIALLNRKTVLINLDHLRFSEQILLDLKELFQANYEYKIQPHICDLFLAYLLKKGYLTMCKNQYDSLTVIRTRLPNAEVFAKITQNMISHFEKHFGINDKLLYKTASELRQLVDDELTLTNDRKTVSSLNELLRNLPEFDHLVQSVGEQMEIYTIQDLLAYILYAVGLRIQSMHDLNTEVYFRHKIGGDVFLFQTQVKRSVLVIVNYDSKSGSAIQDALAYKEQIDRMEFIEKSTYVGINVLTDKDVEITTVVDNPLPSSEEEERLRNLTEVHVATDDGSNPIFSPSFDLTTNES